MGHITPILSSLHWPPIKFRIHFKVLISTYRALHGQATEYSSDLLHPYITSRSVRSSDQGLLVIPFTCLRTKGDFTFEVVAPVFILTCYVMFSDCDLVLFNSFFFFCEALIANIRFKHTIDLFITVLVDEHVDLIVIQKTLMSKAN